MFTTFSIARERKTKTACITKRGQFNFLMTLFRLSPIRQQLSSKLWTWFWQVLPEWELSFIWMMRTGTGGEDVVGWVSCHRGMWFGWGWTKYGWSWRQGSALVEKTAGIAPEGTDSQSNDSHLQSSIWASPEISTQCTSESLVTAQRS